MMAKPMKTLELHYPMIEFLIITLIEKKGKDRSFLENWRPISLVNVGAKIIATRIKTAHCSTRYYPS